jgi:dihydroorotate dehydrogenase (fumarate)
MVALNSIDISPPLLNSSCAWSSDLCQLGDLYTSIYTGAITTRTATVDGFQEDDNHTVRSSSPVIVYLHYSFICVGGLFY